MLFCSFHFLLVAFDALFEFIFGEIGEFIYSLLIGLSMIFVEGDDFVDILQKDLFSGG